VRLQEGPGELAMMNKQKTIYTGARSEIIEKKSRFISTTSPLVSEEEAINFITGVKKEHYNATHNCYAYCLGERDEIMRCSDDGEPSGTAGKPILNVLLGRELHNIAIVVTRYFGGILLGTGGLVRAYSKAAEEGINQSIIITKRYAIRVYLVTDYSEIGKIQYLLANQELTTVDTRYTDVVTLELLVPIEQVGEMEYEITELTNGKTLIRKGEEVYFAIVNNHVEIF